MAEYLSPGLFLEERSASAGPIQGVSTSNYATVGWLPRGPVGTATLVTSPEQYNTTFGGLWANSYVPYAVQAFFSNEGARAYIVRQVPADASDATINVEETVKGAVYVGRYHSSTTITTLSASNYIIDIQVDAFASTEVDVTGDAGVAGSYSLTDIATNINTALAVVDPSLDEVCDVVFSHGGYRLRITSPTTGATSQIIFTAPLATDCTLLLLGGDESNYPITVTGAAAVDRWDPTASSAGTWGNNLQVVFEGDDNYRVAATGGFSKFFFKVFEREDATSPYIIQETHGPVDLTTPAAADYITTIVNADSDLVTIAAGGTPGVPWELTPATRDGFSAATATGEWIGTGDTILTTFTDNLYYTEIVRGSLSVTDGVETFTDNSDGTLTGDAGGSGTINYITGAISVTFNAAPGSGAFVGATYIQQAQGTQTTGTLAGGTDGTGPLTANELTNAALLEAQKQGIYAFDTVDELLNVSIPDLAGDEVGAADLITWAENRKTRFIILDPDSGLTATEHVEYVRDVGSFNTSYAAYYAPQITISDALLDGRESNVPPSGHIAGVYARTDRNRNVGKAPGGIIDGKLNYAIGLEQNYTKGEMDVMYPARVNPLIESPATGRAVWGVRTLSLDAEWRYINVRRLFMFVGKSLENASYWMVFENNGPGLWSRAKLQYTSFLLNLHNEGYFAGTTPDESFQVVADESNNPQAAVDAGLFTIDVYIAPNKPAEFVRIRLQQKVNETAT